MSTQCPWVQQYPPTSRRCFPFIHLGFSLLRLSTGNPVPLLYPVVAYWGCRFKAAAVSVRLAMALFCDIIVSLSSAAAVSRLMRASCVPYISLRLFAPWYPPAQVDYFCFLLHFLYAAWKCAWKFAQVFSSCFLSSHLSQSSYTSV